MATRLRNRWKDGFTLNDKVKKHIKDDHVFPGKQRKSYFLSPDKKSLWKLVQDTFENPDISTPHWTDGNRYVLQKKFNSPVGIHGKTKLRCFSVTVIYDAQDQEIITAYPTTWSTQTLASHYYTCWNKLRAFHSSSQVPLAKCTGSSSTKNLELETVFHSVNTSITGLLLIIIIYVA